jgi:Transposase DDE domain group 1
MPRQSCVTTNRSNTTSTQKVRRDVTKGKRGKGNELRKGCGHKMASRPAARRFGKAVGDRSLSSLGGLAAFGQFIESAGVDEELKAFNGMKPHPNTVYSMSFQLRMSMDLFVAGETRVFGVEALASDPLFGLLNGDMVCSVDTLYEDFNRFTPPYLEKLEALAAKQGLLRVRDHRGPWAHLDIDTTVTPCFGEMEGALPGPNPAYRGRPSFHPMLARVAETRTIVGMQLRSGDRSFGQDDLSTIGAWVRRTKGALRKGTNLCLRMDAAGDFGDLLRLLHNEQTFYVIKAKTTADVLGCVYETPLWKTVDRDANGDAIREVCELPFRREVWGSEDDLPVRVIAVRSRDRQGRQLTLYDDIGWTVQVFLSNRPTAESADEIAWDYDGRGGIEPLIAELKGDWGLGQSSHTSFDANHAVLLMKTLTFNLLHLYKTQLFPKLRFWNTAWIRKTLIRIPARLVRSGRGHKLRLHSGSPVLQMEC